MVRLRHLHPNPDCAGANVAIIRATSNYMFLVDYMILTFEVRPDRRRESNVKINPLASSGLEPRDDIFIADPAPARLDKAVDAKQE